VRAQIALAFAIVGTLGNKHGTLCARDTQTTRMTASSFFVVVVDFVHEQKIAHSLLSIDAPQYAMIPTLCFTKARF
jgi:hypothetical protein